MNLIASTRAPDAVKKLILPNVLWRLKQAREVRAELAYKLP
jgi:hypothetical protein